LNPDCLIPDLAFLISKLYSLKKKEARINVYVSIKMNQKPGMKFSGKQCK
jgi:hypothetical protein